MMKLVDLLNESVIGDLIIKSLGKIPKVAVSAAETSVKGIVSDLIRSSVQKGGLKQITRKAITSHPNYFKTIGQLSNETAMITHGMPLDEVVTKIGKDAADEIVKKSSTTVDNALTQATKEAGATIKADVKTAQAATDAAKKSKAPTTSMDAALKQLKPNQKMAREAARMEKILQNMDQVTYKKLTNQVNKGSKVTTGTGPTIGPTLPPTGTVTVSTPKGFFTATMEQIKLLPGRVRRVIVSKYVLKTLAAVGVGAAALYIMYKFMFPEDSIIITDEDGNDLGDKDLPKGEWAQCIQELLNNKEAKLVQSSTGQVSVSITTSDYPGGLQFYPNGKVLDVAKKVMGTWKCRSGAVTIQEQTEQELDSDVETMIDLLDFPVTPSDLQSAVSLLQKYANSPKGKEFLNMYQKTGLGGGSLKKSVDNIFTTQATSVRAKSKLLSLYNDIISGKSGSGQGMKKGLKDIEIVWSDGRKDGGKDGGGVPTPKKSTYVDCNSKPLPHSFGCKSDKIAEVQKCLEIKSDGKLGPITRKTLIDNEFDMKNGLTQEIYDAVMKMCNKAKPEEESPEDAARRRRLETPLKSVERPSTKLGYDIKPIDPDKFKNIKLEIDPDVFYKALVANDLIVGEDGNRRIKYKGPDLDKENLSKLDTALDRMGYDRIKQMDKRYGEKYVYEKR